MEVLAPEAEATSVCADELPSGQRVEGQRSPGQRFKSDDLLALSLSRRTFLAAGLGVIGMGLYAGEIGRHELVTEHISIAIEHLPTAFVGMRIVQISDFHYATYTEPFYLHRMVRRVNALKPDLVLLTGDFISMAPEKPREAVAYAPMCAAVLGQLTCPLRYGVLGNHDWMVNGPAVLEAMEAVGIRMLYNEHVPLERGTGNGAGSSVSRIWLAGLADALSPDIDIAKTVPPRALADCEPVILMGHEPDTANAVAKFGVDLMLSGHTHGGQVRLPFLPAMLLPPLGKRYVEGHFTLGRTQLYVNRGIGAVGLPFRFNCPSEITEITLRQA